MIIDDEIIRYESIGPEGRWDTFQKCQRGSWDTRPAAHKSEAECRHYGVDGCINGYIVDQETGLFDEATSRMAQIFNTCGFDMVYFDGSEDVDRRRFNYYMSNFRAVTMSKFTKRPIIHMGGGYTHNLWHSYTRGATIDQYPGHVPGTHQRRRKDRGLALLQGPHRPHGQACTRLSPGHAARRTGLVRHRPRPRQL